ncbi:MAG: 2-C-methyl-D-erythritol 4-phosphate cytidylyltransferase [Thermomicrobiales bacterium]|nr:2-C-methyl-D-erythritol 4-phosphate cytidylyltransferase [Thermomicrobiales bacterium]
MSAAAIIVAAGSGQRFGDPGKSFTLVAGKPMAWWSLTAAAAAPSVDELVLVCGDHSLAAASTLVAKFATEKPIRIVLGGKRRQDSALAGVRATSDKVSVVSIHDAARPLVISALFDAVIAAAMEHGAAITAIPVSDTIKRIVDGRVRETIPRDDLVAVQTPQAFDKRQLLDAFEFAERDGATVTDEASLIEQMGGAVVVVPGAVTNIKITYPDDHAIAEMFMRRIRE